MTIAVKPRPTIRFRGRSFMALVIAPESPLDAWLADLEGVRRMSLLAVQLRSERIAAEQVPQKLREATARNPYTAKPFAWDEANHAIVFSGIAPGERGRHAILY